MKKLKENLIIAYWFACILPFFFSYEKISFSAMVIIFAIAIINLANAGRLINKHLKAQENERTIQ